MSPPSTSTSRTTVPFALYLAALGVVYGDIGTSPLYAFRECFVATAHGAARTPENVLGVLSLVFWALMIVVTVKYLFYVMRADDNGEGGVLALMALAGGRATAGRSVLLVTSAGLVGAGLLFGDGIITPAISVLSAVEGLKEIDPVFTRFVVPLTIATLVGLFAFQSRGTAKVGAVFGPVMVVWFGTLGLTGLLWVVRAPEVLVGVWPGHALAFLGRDPLRAFTVLGAVFLAVTGGEALYADMGHFGLAPIRRAWFTFVLPCLLLNYFGQGALVLHHPEAFDQPFFSLVPRYLLVPMVLLSTAATVIASQAVISGVFSLARQASMLGFYPRIRVSHTSDAMAGQIYVPKINWGMLFATVTLVLAFGSSTRLASAYGIAVTGTMLITTLLAFQVSRLRWGWPLWIALPITVLFLIPDVAFLSANVVKIESGGWVPLVIAGGIYVLGSTWNQGRRLLGERVQAQLVSLDDFRELIRVEMGRRVPGTAVFMTSNARGAPPALVHNFMHNHVVHERVILLTVTTVDTARVPEPERLEVNDLGQGFFRVTGRYGFMESPDVPALLASASIDGVSMEYTTYFLGREIPLAERDRLGTWRHRLFAAMARNSANATTFFNLPPDRVMEIGYQLEL